MSDQQQRPNRRIVLGMPGYGKQTAAAGRALWNACENMKSCVVYYSNGSLLASNFNQLWCMALNLVHQGERVDYFAMLHDDVAPENGWLDALIDELEAKQLDILGAVVPIKDGRGMTSLALHKPNDNWMPFARLSMHDVYELPETFTSEDIGHPLLLNTGCWVARWNQEWCRKVHFEINDRIVFNTAVNRYQAQTEPEDWQFSRLCHEMKLKIGATRKIALTHQGETEFTNTRPWGSQAFDRESVAVSPIPGAFPRDIKGWLSPEEGKALAELARGKRVLEIGSYCGLSTICMARTAEHVTACDYFDGRATPVPENTLADFRANVARYGVADRVCTIHPSELDSHSETYDLVFIDGAHDYESVIEDIRKASHVLNENGLMVFHDYQHPCHPGLTQAVTELVADGCEILSVLDSLAVVRLPAAVPLEV